MMKKHYLLIITVYFTSSFATASPDTNCNSAESQSQMTDCISNALIKKEKKLQHVYDALMQKAQTEDNELGWPEPHKKALLLQQAQQRWASFRDVACQFEHFDSLNGSAYSDYLNRCKLQYTQKRLSNLQWFLENP